MRPEERVAVAVARWGDAEVVAACARLLTHGSDPPSGSDADVAALLGGRSDVAWFAGGKPPGHAYWARVWAARALRYVWAPAAGSAVVTALTDEQWRVREQAAKVVADRELATAADELVLVCMDEVPRVRAAAAHALSVVGEGEHADTLRDLTDDPEVAVSRAAARALRDLGRRLDRDLG